MKRALLSFVLIVFLCVSSYAEMGFLTAAGLGQGRIALMPLVLSRHYGPIRGVDYNDVVDGGDTIQVYDWNGTGLKLIYGIIDGLDIFGSYSEDTLTHANDLGMFTFGSDTMDSRQLSASTSGGGLKYTFVRATEDWEYDMALVVGYERSDLSIRYNQSTPTVYNKDIKYDRSGYLAGMVMSTNNLNEDFIPYVGLYYRTVTWGENILTEQMDGFSYTVNIGAMFKLSKNIMLAGEYWREHQEMGDMAFKGGGKTKPSTNSLQGLSIGLMYIF